jgi:hypothetical protein
MIQPVQQPVDSGEQASCSYHQPTAAVAAPQDDMMPRYAELVYNGFWFSPERLALQALVDKTQEYCSGAVRLKLYKVRGREHCLVGGELLVEGVGLHVWG